jgi:hypothetical protein
VLWHAGGTIIGANDTYNDREYKERIDLRPNETQVKIEVKKSLNAVGDAGTYNITVSALDTVLNTSLHLRVLLVEDGNETVKNAKFRYTPKEMLDDVPITLQNAGDKVYLNNTFTNQYDMWKISLVVFVQDDSTKEVLQAQTSLFPGNLGPQLNVPSLDFNMLEDTVDDHLDLDEVFFDPQGEAMSFQVQSISATSHMQYNKDKDNVVTFTPEADWFGEELFKVTADDTYGKNKKTGHKFTVTVDPVNDAPRLKSAIKDFSMMEGDIATHIDLSNNFEDIEGDTLIFSATGYEQLEVSVSPSSGLVSIEAPHGVYNVTEELLFHASDGELEGVEEAFVTVKHTNHGPGYLDPIEDIIMDEDAVDDSIDLDDAFFDFDDDPLQFTVFGNNYIDVDIDPVDNDVTLTPQKDWHGEEYLTIAASDNIAEPIEEEFMVTVNPVNDAPVVVAELEELEMDEDTVLETDQSLGYVFYDADLDPLAFDVTSSENLDIAINEDGTVVITPAPNWNGDEVVTFTASDGIETTGYDITVEVIAVNDPVIIESTTPGDDRAFMDEGETLNFSVVAIDVDGDDIMYTWYINGRLYSQGGETLRFSADFLSAGTYDVMVICSDGPSEVEHVWELKVQDVNRKPDVIITSPQAESKYKANEVIEFKADVSDADASDDLTITWSVDGRPIEDSDADTLKYSLKEGSHVIKITVSDGKDVGTDEVKVKVKRKEAQTPGFEAALLLMSLAIGITLFRRRWN